MLFFQDKLPHKCRFWLNQIIHIAAIGLFTILGYLGYLQLVDEYVLEITSESLNLPQWIYTLCIPIGCTMIVVRILEGMIRDCKGEN